jgi:hypothetical protein
VGGAGAGIVIFETGRIFGGDQDYIYLGKYSVTPDGKQLSADVDVSNHSGNRSSIFGPLNQFTLHIEAQVPATTTVGAIMQANGHIVANPMLKIGLLMTLRAPLP